MSKHKWYLLFRTSLRGACATIITIITNATFYFWRQSSLSQHIDHYHALEMEGKSWDRNQMQVESYISNILSSLKFQDIVEREHNPRNLSLHWKTCVVVGSSPGLMNYSLGHFIDQHDAIFRSNIAPSKGYERSVGSRTTVRAVNPVTRISRIPKDFNMSIVHIDPPFIRHPKTALTHWIDDSRKQDGVHVFETRFGIELCNLILFVSKNPHEAPSVIENFFEWKQRNFTDPYWHPLGKVIPAFSPDHCSTGLVTLLDALLLCDQVSIVGYSGCDGFSASLSKEHYFVGPDAGSKLPYVSKRYSEGQQILVKKLILMDKVRCAYPSHTAECATLSQFWLLQRPNRNCAVVGSSGVLTNKGLGPEIDRHDIVIRFNLAPILGYESDVGSRTDIRMINCPSFDLVSKSSNAEKADFLKSIDPSSSMLLSCRGPASAVRWTHDFRQKCFSHIFSKEEMHKHLKERGKVYEPTFGFEGVARAMVSCARVHVYGMTDPNAANATYHYYKPPGEIGVSWLSKHNGKDWDFYKPHNFELEYSKLWSWEQWGHISLHH